MTTFGDAASGYQNAGTNTTATLPAGAVLGGVVFAFGALSDVTLGDPGVSGGAGAWTSVDGVVDDNVCRTRLWWRTVAPGDPGATITMAWTSSGKGGLILAHYPGTNSSPIDTFATTTEAGTDATHDAPGVTPSLAGCWVADFVAYRGTAAGSATAPGGRTKRAEQLGFGAGTVVQVVGDSNGPVTSGAPTGAATYTFDQASANAVGWSVAIRPGGGAPLLINRARRRALLVR